MQAGPGCARMEEALHLLRSTGAPPGALGVLGQAPPPLAPKLQEEISEALLDLKAEALLGYLQVSAMCRNSEGKSTWVPGSAWLRSGRGDGSIAGAPWCAAG